MSDIMFQRIAKDLKNVEAQYIIAADLIGAMKEAGETTAEMESELRKLEIRKEKWERMLEARGIKAE